MGETGDFHKVLSLGDSFGGAVDSIVEQIKGINSVEAFRDRIDSFMGALTSFGGGQ